MPRGCIDLIKEFLTPIKCNCMWVTEYEKHRPEETVGMDASNLRAWARINKRPDLVLHADCVEEHEKLIQCGEDLKDMQEQNRDADLPPWLLEELSSWAWPAWIGRWPCDLTCGAAHAISRVERIKAALAMIQDGKDEVDARALWDDEL